MNQEKHGVELLENDGALNVGGGAHNFKVSLTPGRHHIKVKPVTRKTKEVLLNFLLENGCYKRHKYISEGCNRSAHFSKGLFEMFQHYCNEKGIRVENPNLNDLIISSDDDTEEA